MTDVGFFLLRGLRSRLSTSTCHGEARLKASPELAGVRAEPPWRAIAPATSIDPADGRARPDRTFR
jgi:hypothetical protein